MELYRLLYYFNFVFMEQYIYYLIFNSHKIWSGKQEFLVAEI